MRRTPRSPLKIAASEWNRIEAASSRTGTTERRKPVRPNYVQAVGLNSSGATLVAGSPVYYSSFATDGTVAAYVTNPLGYYTLHHCFWPMSAGERATFATNNSAYSRVGVVLEEIAIAKPGRFAISGVVGVKCTGAARYARPARTSAAYQSEMTGDVWGYRILGTYASWSMLDLDDLFRGNVIGATKVGGLAVGVEDLVTVSSADWPAFTVVTAIPGSTTIVLLPTETQWLALKVC